MLYVRDLFLHATQVYAAGSEDMDTLTFNAPILFRHLTFSEAKKQPISEINLKEALEGLDMNMSQVATFLFVFLRKLTIVPSLSTYVSSLDATTSSPSKASVRNLHSS